MVKTCTVTTCQNIFCQIFESQYLSKFPTIKVLWFTVDTQGRVQDILKGDQKFKEKGLECSPRSHKDLYC